ncbi:MAG TPA: nitrilase-related carbon-nitrogen hydrolase [Verrucomicrobiae bacterium]|nr:nitrilase-related carbon-nitrogen hydrolase [Verrucomicrobiae bacterium]
MKILKPSAEPLDWKKSFLCLLLAVVCFHLAYTSIKFPALGLFIFGYAYFLTQLTNQLTVRRAFYFGLAAGFLCDAPQLYFFWKIFSAAAIVLWLVAGFWIGLFTAISCGAIRRWGKVKAMWLIPIIWTGLEYFRSELYYLKFSWLNIGYALQFPFGMYGVGFSIFAIIVGLFYARIIKIKVVESIFIAIFIFLLVWMFLLPSLASTKRRPGTPVQIAGIQMEFPPAGILPEALDHALKKNTNAPIFALSEYTLDGGVPDSLKNWCRDHDKFLIVGGKDIVTNDVYYNTAFVVGTNGEIVFKQAKCVPIQFFHDGLPAPKQEVWNSPFGKIGICICYDLSYTRVTDELVRQGAQLLVVPTMDVEEWGRHEHELHSRVALVRAAEYGIPIFRVASSGISQAVNGNGAVVAQTRLGGNGDIFSAQLRLPLRCSLPLDRFLAPICTVITAGILIVLLFLRWKNQRAIQPPPTTKSS